MSSSLSTSIKSQETGTRTQNFRPEKEDPNRVRMTVGGDRINCDMDCGTTTADLLTVKLLWNSIVSTDGAKFFTMDIKNFYLNIPLTRYEYMRLKMSKEIMN